MKTNRILALLLAAVMLLSIFTGCNTAEPAGTSPIENPAGNDNLSSTNPGNLEACAHVWTETESAVSKAEYDKFLEQSGQADNVPVDEGYIAAYIKTVRTCSHCDETETIIQRRDVKDPNYKPNGDTNAPTIPEANAGDKECSHKYDTKTVAPTCSSKGYTQYTCSKCGKSYTSDYTAAIAHKYGPWSTKEATCTNDGTKTRSCETCGKTDSETIKSAGHDYGAWSTTKKATCDTNGVKTRKCSTCGETQQETIASVGHTWDKGKVTAKPTTCSEMGIRTYTCTVCGRTKTEQIKGNHAFGEWEYEEYTYQQQDPTFGTWHDRPSHRKVRICEKCGYKEYGNSPDHPCAKGSPYHTVTTVKKGTCTVPERKRSTCNICGWSMEYDGAKGQHTISEKKVHLADYGDYTNELDATIRTCSKCDYSFVDYHQGEGYSDYNRYYTAINTFQGQAYANMYPNDGDANLLEHPEWQTVERDFKYDKAGYVKQYTLYWWYNGQQYSQVIKCGKGEIETWFKEYGLVATHPNSHYSMEIYGAYVQPYSIGYSG